MTTRKLTLVSVSVCVCDVNYKIVALFLNSVTCLYRQQKPVAHKTHSRRRKKSANLVSGVTMPRLKYTFKLQ